MTTKIYCLHMGIVACLIAILDSGVASAQRSDNQKPKYAGLTEIQAEQLENKVDGLIRELGVVQSASVADIRAITGGTLIELTPEGTKVKKGDQIGRIDSSEIEAQVAAQSIAVANARAKVIAATSIIKNQTIERDTAREIGAGQIEISELRLKVFDGEEGEFAVQAMDIEDEISASQKVYEARLIVLQELKSGNKADVAEAEAMLARATAELAILKRKKKLHSVTKDLRKAELQLAMKEQEATLAKATRELQAELDQSEAKLAATQQAEAIEVRKLELLKEQLAGSVFIAPQDGVIVYPSVRRGQDPIQEGTILRERQAVVQIADLSDIQVAALVHETRVGRVQVGQKATIRIDAYAGREFSGTVKHINRTPEPTTFLDNSGKKFKVIVSLEKPLPIVRLGMTAEVDIDAQN